jgi:hypothetical protein
LENAPAFDSADDDMMHRPRRIDAGIAWHGWLDIKKKS